MSNALLALTDKQKKVLNLIYDYINTSGFPPALADLKNELNLSSNQSVLNFLDTLEEKGCIKRENGQARGIKILPLGFKVIGKEQLVPVVGSVAAGPYLESFTELSFDWQEIPTGLVPGETLRQTEDMFILQVVGDSMINAGIDDRDMLLVKKSKSGFVNGDIVVAYKEGGATVKRFVVEKNKMFLKPENPNYQNIRIFSGEVKFDGKAILNLTKNIKIK